MEAAYSPGQWVNFAIGLATASGALLTASLLLLLPGQGRTAVGAEMLVIGAVLVYRTARTWPVLRAGLTREAAISYALGAIAHSLIVLGAIGLIVRAGGGLYVIAAALVLALVRALSDIWILFTGIEEAGASRSTAALGPDDQD